MPARKQRKYIKRRERRTIFFKWKPFLLGIVLVLFVLAIKAVFTQRFWTGDNTSILAIQKADGDISVAIFDPLASQITNIIIPGDTEVNVARGYGIWKLKSIWDLGKNEGIGGELFVQTIIKSFKFPVFIWADRGGENLVSGNPLIILKTIFIPFDTNLTLGDKVSLAFFALKVKNVDRVTIDLKKTTFLRNRKLEDGTDGYVITDLPSPKLYSYFLEKEFSKKAYRVLIKNGSGENENVHVVGNLIEVMGGKVSSILKEKTDDGYCSVKSKNPGEAVKVANLFGCKTSDDPSQNYDMEIVLGTKFTKIF